MKETIYDAVIIGGGISGLTAAYNLRDKNILVLEEENRFGGRVLSEKVHDATNNIGTQFFGVEDTSFFHLIEELGIKWVSHDTSNAPFGVYVNNKLHTDLDSLLTGKAKLSAIKLMSVIHRKEKMFKLPVTDPRWKKLAAKNVVELQQGYNPDLMALVNTYMRGACVAKPERTSAGMGMWLSKDIFNTDAMGFVTGGFQKITEALVDKLDGKAMHGAEVTRVEEHDGIVTVCYKKDGEEHIVKSKSAVMAVPPMLALKLIPGLPDWKKQAMEKVIYGPITVISVFLKRDIPWKRVFGMISADTIFQGITDATYDTEEDKNEDNPIIYNFIVSIPPDEREEIDEFLAKSDEEILELTFKDFKRLVPDADIKKHIIGTKVTRFPIGELELSPEYYLEALPELPKPVGNIHFCGDYTEMKSFVDGAAFSGMRAAVEIGSSYIASEDEIIKFPKIAKWGGWGWTTMLLNILLIAAGFLLPGGSGTTMSIGAGVLFLLTALFPSFFSPNKLAYKVLLGISLGFGVIVGLIGGLI